MAGKDHKLELIRRVPLFEHIGGRELEKIRQLADEVDVPAGKVLINEGATAQEFFVVIEGSMRVEQSGREINRLGPGDFFGEIALVDGGKRTATVTTTVPSRCFVLGPRQFQNVLHQNVEIIHAVMKALSTRVREAGAAKAD